MIATLLNSPHATQLSIEIIKVFIQARKTGFQFSSLEMKYEKLNQLQIQHGQAKSGINTITSSPHPFIPFNPERNGH